MLTHDDWLRSDLDHPLRLLVAKLRHRPGWTFALDMRAKSLIINALVEDSTNKYTSIMDSNGKIKVMSQFDVPSQLSDGMTWTRWLFDRIMDVACHEEMEHFRVEGELIYDPHRNNYVEDRWSDITNNSSRVFGPAAYSPYVPYDRKAGERL